MNLDRELVMFALEGHALEDREFSVFRVFLSPHLDVDCFAVEDIRETESDLTRCGSESFVYAPLQTLCKS